MLPKADPASPRVAVVFGDERITRYNWPKDLDVRVYEATIAEAKKVVALCADGKIDHVVVHSRFTPLTVKQMLNAQKEARVHVWTSSPVTLARELHSFIGLTPPVEAPAPIAPPAPPARRAEERAYAYMKGKRIWSEEEHAALLLAHEQAAGDRTKLLDLYLDLVMDVDAPARTSAEIISELERLLEERKQAQQAAGERLAAAEVEIAELTRTTEELRGSLADAEARSQKNAAERDSAQKALREMQRDRDAWKAKAERTSGAEFEKLKQENGQLTQRLTELTEGATKLLMENNARFESYSRVMDRLMAWVGQAPEIMKVARAHNSLLRVSDVEEKLGTALIGAEGMRQLKRAVAAVGPETAADVAEVALIEIAQRKA